MPEYTPNTDEVRLQWVEFMCTFSGKHNAQRYRAEFDRWLAEHDLEVRKVERAAAFDEGMYALGDTIGVDPEWYDSILRPSEEH